MKVKEEKEETKTKQEKQTKKTEKNNTKKTTAKQEEKTEKIDTKKTEDNKEESKKENKRKHTRKENVIFGFQIFTAIILTFILLGIIFIYLFFKTSLFQKYKEIWVQTAMTTMSHQYLATWFLSDAEIQEIMNKLEVKNEENSDSENITIEEIHEEVTRPITVQTITGKGYVGHVMIVPDASKVKLVDGRQSGRGSKLSEIVKKYNAIGGINAGGFLDPNGNGAGNILCDAAIMDQKLLYGNKNTRYSLVGLDANGKLILGKYNYAEAMSQGIVSAVEFTPYIIVNGNNQIKNSNSGGIHPRMAIGQRQDGTMIFVAVDGRRPGYSIGTNLLEMQNIFEKYGAYNAANLDGGTSSVMAVNGELINDPIDSTGAHKTRFIATGFGVIPE